MKTKMEMKKLSLFLSLGCMAILFIYIKSQYLVSYKDEIIPNDRFDVDVNNQYVDLIDINFKTLPKKRASFKFVLAETVEKGELIRFVQGCPVEKVESCKHPDAFNLLKSRLRNENINTKRIKLIGGGRLVIEKDQIKVFGYSKTYKKRLGDEYDANGDSNYLTCREIQNAFKAAKVSWSKDGYEEGDEKKIHDFKKC